MNSEDIKSLITQLLKTGEILGTKVFELALRQIHLKIVIDSLITIVSISLAVLFFKLLKRGLNEEFSDRYKDEAARGFGVFFTAVFCVQAFINILYIISYSMNPEWYAVQLLVNTITGN